MLTSRTVAAIAACLIIAGCGKKEPTGQVAATVDGKEITMLELKDELGDFRAPDAKTRREAERAALQQIVNRKILADAAREKKIDKRPEFARQDKKLEEALLVQSWQQDIVKAVPPPSREEIDKFIAEHPDLYAQHKIFLTQQIRFARPQDSTFVDSLRPIKTFDELIALLQSRNIPFQRGNQVVDALRIDPQMTAQIMKLPPGELFVVPAGQNLAVTQILETRVAPVPNNLASQHASQYLKNTRAREAVTRAFQQQLAAAASKVKYNAAYGAPPKKGAAPAAKAGAPPAKAPAAPAKAPQ